MNPRAIPSAMQGRQGVAGENLSARWTAPSVAVLAMVLDVATTDGSLSPSHALAAYSALLAVYLAIEIAVLRAQSPALIWINPVALASVLTIALPYVLTNSVFMASDGVLLSLGLPPFPTVWMNQLMFQVVLAATAMWAGYRSGTGRFLEYLLERSRVLGRWVSHGGAMNNHAVIALLITSGIARAWKIHLGVFGYSASIEALGATAEYREYLGIAESLGRLALACVAMEFASSARPTLLQRGSLWLVLGIEVAFGFLSGFKSAVVWPFLIVGAVFYSQRRRVPQWLVPAVTVSILAGYAIIEPFRDERNTSATFDGSSIASIVGALGSNKSLGEGTVPVRDVVAQVGSRVNLLYVGSLGIAHAANVPLADDAPRFLENIVLAPVMAAVPRLLWPSKPMLDAGAWYNREVMGNYHPTSVGMGPVTYLNYAGGAAGVLLGFFFLGAVQRGLFNGLRHFGRGGLIVLLGLLTTVSEIDSAFHVVLVSIIRLFPMLIVAQRVLLRRVGPNEA